MYGTLVLLTWQGI